MTKLMRCPLCEGKAIIETYLWGPPPGLERWFVSCQRCSVKVCFFRCKQEAVEAWNTQTREINEQNDLRCPFCGSLNILVGESTPDSYVVYHVYCTGCMAQGPKASSQWHAIFAWGIGVVPDVLIGD